MSKNKFHVDHTQTDVYFKIKKTLRYICLYVLSQNVIKIKYQYHNYHKAIGEII